MKRICLIFILISTAPVLFSQSVWTGNAAVSTEKEFESYYSDDSSTGKYLGASNSFPGSTEVTVTNPRNGKSVSVSIVKRLSQPGLFLVLSPEAGLAISLPKDDILNVEVVVRRKNEEVFNKYTEDLPYSEDPDLNPSAELTAEKKSDPPLTDSPVPVVTAKASEPEVKPPVATTVNEYIPPVVLGEEGALYEEGYDPLVIMEGDEEKTSEPEEIIEIIDDPLALAQAITSSVSEPDIPLPERYDESDLPDSYVKAETPGESSSTGKEPVEKTVILSEPSMLETEELDSDFMDAEIDDLLIADNEFKVTETPEPEISEIEEFVVPETETEDTEVIVIDIDEDLEPIVILPESESSPETPVPEKPENVIYFLTPGDFRPPPQSEEKIEKEKEKVKEKTIVALPVERNELNEMIVTELRNGGSYLQLGTYRSVEVLYSRIKQISNSYPSIVLTVGEGESKLYKLLIGPISRDEKGIVMTRFRSLGFEDAFLYTPRQTR